MDKSLATPTAMPSFRRVGKILLPIALIYLAMLLGQPAGFEPARLIREIIGNPTILVQQLISGLANAAIVTIIAIGYTMVYGIVEMVNFAHSSVFMLGTFVTLIFLAARWCAHTPVAGDPGLHSGDVVLRRPECRD